MDRRIERGQATRDRVIATARDLFGEHGYDGTSISAVLSESEAARGALYHHFATKEELFDAVLEREVARLAEAATAAALKTADPVASLRAGCSAWLRLALDPSVQRIVLLDPPAVVGWTRWRQLDERYTLGGIQASIRAMADEGRVPVEQVDLLAHMVLAAASEAALLIARADDPQAALKTGLAALDRLLDRVFGERLAASP